MAALGHVVSQVLVTVGKRQQVLLMLIQYLPNLPVRCVGEIFKDTDDKLTECERCEEWIYICLNCSGMSTGHYDSLNNAELGAHLQWYCQECNYPRAIILIAVKTDIEEKCKSYRPMSKFKLEISEEIQSVKSGLESRITGEVNRMTRR